MFERLSKQPGASEGLFCCYAWGAWECRQAKGREIKTQRSSLVKKKKLFEHLDAGMTGASMPSDASFNVPINCPYLLSAAWAVFTHRNRELWVAYVQRGTTKEEPFPGFQTCSLILFFKETISFYEAKSQFSGMVLHEVLSSREGFCLLPLTFLLETARSSHGSHRTWKALLLINTWLWPARLAVGGRISLLEGSAGPQASMPGPLMFVFHWYH